VNPAAPSRRPAFLAAAIAAAGILIAGRLIGTDGGLAGVYSFVGADGREVEVTRRVDAAIDFPVPQRIDAAYIYNWDYGRFGFPADKPPYVVRWRGVLAVPEGGTYRFGLDASGTATLAIDGEPLAIPPDAAAARPLSAGLHDLAVEYRLPDGEARLVLSWQPPGRRLEPIPTTRLAPDRIVWAAAGTRRDLGWLLAAGLALAAGAIAVLRRRAPEGPAGRLADAVAAHRVPLALAAIVMLAALLRFHDYALVPFHHETADEYQHAWEGWHLLHEGVPAAWSTFPDRYPAAATRDFRWFGDRYVLVRPYFDHPPLFSIPVGLLCSLAGARTFLDCTLPVMRLVPILLSLVGVVLLRRLALTYGASQRAALLACLVYATLPVIVMAHRLVKAESLLALLFMGAMIAVGAEDGAPSTDAGPPKRRALRAGVLGFLAIWTKATGLVVPAAAALVFAGRRRWRDVAIVAALAAAALAAYAAYGAAYDAGIWRQVLAAQSTSKWVSMDSFHDLLSGKVVVKWFGRGTYLFLVLAAVVAARGRARALFLPLVLYATVLALTADHRVIYGWYRVPLYPFLCVAAGLYLDRMLEEGDPITTLGFAITAVLSAFLYALPEALAQARPAAWIVAILAVAPLVPRLVIDRPWTVALARAGAVTLLVAFLVANVATVRDLLTIYAATRGVQ
jgi:PA14 domain-containing protein